MEMLKRSEKKKNASRKINSSLEFKVKSRHCLSLVKFTMNHGKHSMFVRGRRLLCFPFQRQIFGNLKPQPQYPFLFPFRAVTIPSLILSEPSLPLLLSFLLSLSPLCYLFFYHFLSFFSQCQANIIC